MNISRLKAFDTNQPTGSGSLLVVVAYFAGFELNGIKNLNILDPYFDIYVYL